MMKKRRYIRASSRTAKWEQQPKAHSTHLHRATTEYREMQKNRPGERDEGRESCFLALSFHHKTLSRNNLRRGEEQYY